MTVNAKEICSKIIPLPLRIANPPKVGGIVDDIINPSYTSTIGLLLLHKNAKKSSGPSKAPKANIGGLFSKVKNLLEPLLP